MNDATKQVSRPLDSVRPFHRSFLNGPLDLPKTREIGIGDHQRRLQVFFLVYEVYSALWRPTPPSDIKTNIEPLFGEVKAAFSNDIIFKSNRQRQAICTRRNGIKRKRTNKIKEKRSQEESKHDEIFRPTARVGAPRRCGNKVVRMFSAIPPSRIPA